MKLRFMPLAAVAGLVVSLLPLAPAQAAATASRAVAHPAAATSADRQTALETKALANAKAHKGKGKRLVADYNTPARQGDVKYTADQIPYNQVTDIIHVGIELTADGGLSIPDGFYDKSLVTSAHRAGAHVVLLLGGESRVAGASTTVKKKAAKNVVRWVHKHHYDGVDIDWEYPDGKAQRNFLVSFFKLLRSGLGKHAILSEDVAPWTVESYEVKKLSKIINWFNVMTYDCAGPWTSHGQLNEPILKVPSDPYGDECTPGQSDQESVQIMLAAGAKRHQLNQGTPFYGYWYKTVSSLYGACPGATADGCGDDAVPSVTYADVVAMLASGEWVLNRDPEALVPYLLRKDGTPGFVTYDDPRSTYDRVLYSDWVQKLGGSFMWALEEGRAGTSQPLLAAMHAATRGKKLS